MYKIDNLLILFEPKNMIKSPRTERIANNNKNEKKRNAVLEIFQNLDNVRSNCIVDCPPKKSNKKLDANEFIKDLHPDPLNL